MAMTTLPAMVLMLVLVLALALVLAHGHLQCLTVCWTPRTVPVLLTPRHSPALTADTSAPLFEAALEAVTARHWPHDRRWHRVGDSMTVSRAPAPSARCPLRP